MKLHSEPTTKWTYVFEGKKSNDGSFKAVKLEKGPKTIYSIARSPNVWSVCDKFHVSYRFSFGQGVGHNAHIDKHTYIRANKGTPLLPSCLTWIWEGRGVTVDDWLVQASISWFYFIAYKINIMFPFIQFSWLSKFLNLNQERL